jgi:hypothetical protein
MLFVGLGVMQTKHKVYAGAFFLTILVLLSFKSAQVSSGSEPTKSPSFSPDINEKIIKAFLEVWQQYKSLHAYEFEVVQKRLKSSTMQARPVFGLSQIFGKSRQYRLNVAKKILESGELKVADLPEKVLRGWFAHELGHIVDYENHSNVGMIAYGIRYSLSDDYKREREHEADSIAIRNGFKQEIIATKNYLLENDFISPKYQDQLKKYYMSVRGVELCPEEVVPIKPKIEL